MILQVLTIYLFFLIYMIFQMIGLDMLEYSKKMYEIKNKDFIKAEKEYELRPEPFNLDEYSNNEIK